MSITIHNIKRETEKALLITVEIENPINSKLMDFWFPKSQVSVDGNRLNAPKWLLRAKLDEKFPCYTLYAL